MDTVQLKNKAINLRKSGLSYGEIIKEINVPKSTLSYWLKDISLNDRQQASLNSRLVERQKRGRFSTSIALRARKVFKEKTAFDSAEKEFKTLSKDHGESSGSSESSDFFWSLESFFTTGIALYWAEGGKKGNHFQFVNSDPEMISFMIEWVGKYLKVSKSGLSFRIFIRESYMAQNIDGFWARSLAISRERLKITIQKDARVHGSHNGHHTVVQNPYYKGSCMITITGVAVLRKMLAWQNLLIKYYKDTHTGRHIGDAGS